MTDFRDLKIGDGHEDSWSLWDGVRDYIEDEDFVSSVDAELERCESEEEAGKIFDHVIEYMNDMAPEGYAFGVNECNEVGFWPEDEIYEEDDEDESIESSTEGALEAGEEEEETEKTLRDLKSLLPALAKSAQKIYDAWEQDEEGQDVEYGPGGICHDIAEEMASVLNENGIEATTIHYEIGENHVAVVCKLNDGIYSVDIPPSVYESGSGYVWKKLDEVSFTPDDIIIEQITSDPSDFDQYMDRILNDVPDYMKITRMCQYCKKIMEKGDPKRVSHGICPECYEEWEKDPEGFEKRFFKGEKFRKNPQGTVSFWFSKDRFQTPEKAKSWLRKYGSYRTGHYSTDGFWSFPQMPESRVRRYKGKIRSKYISDGVMVKFVPSRLL